MKKRFFNRRQLKKFEVSQSTIVVIPFKILPFKSAAKKDYYFQRPGTPNRKSITSIDSREQDRLLTRTNTKHQLLAKHPPGTTVVIGHKERHDKPAQDSNQSCQASKSVDRPSTSTATTNTDSLSVALEKKISESKKATAETSTETDPSAKVLLSKKVQTDISLTDEHEIAETSSPKGKKKPLKKQKSLSKITKNFGHML